ERGLLPALGRGPGAAGAYREGEIVAVDQRSGAREACPRAAAEKHRKAGQRMQLDIAMEPARGQRLDLDIEEPAPKHVLPGGGSFAFGEMVGREMKHRQGFV